MITCSFMYWITRLDEILFLFGTIATICIVGGIAIAFPFTITYLDWANRSRQYRDDINETNIPQMRKAMTWLFSIGFAMLLANVFIPSTKQAAAIVVVPKIANSESLAEISTAVKDAAVKWLNEAAEEVKKGQ